MYKMKIHKDALLEALSLTNLAAKKGTGIISSSTLFVPENGGLTLKASDRRVLSSTKIEEGPEGLISISGSSQTPFTIESYRLSQWAENIFSDEITLEIDPSDRNVKAICGDAEAYFRSLDPQSFPDFESQYKDAEHEFSCTMGEFSSALGFVKPFVGGANSGSNKLKVAQLRGNQFFGTNNRILAIYESSSLDAEVKVGKDEINRVLSFIKTQEGDTEMDVLASDNLFFLKTEHGELFGFTKPFGDLPKLQVVPNKLDEPEIWSLNKSELNHAIAALTASASEDDYTLKVEFSASERASNASSMTLKMRDAQDKHDATMDVSAVVDKQDTDSDVSFKVNYEFLVSALGLYSGNEVTAAFNEEGKYLKLYEQTEDGDLKICLITLRLN